MIEPLCRQVQVHGSADGWIDKWMDNLCSAGKWPLRALKSWNSLFDPSYPWINSNSGAHYKLFTFSKRLSRKLIPNNSKFQLIDVPSKGDQEAAREETKPA